MVKAYFNVGVLPKMEEADLQKWTETYNQIRSLIKKYPDVSLQDAIKATTTNWDSFEIEKFSTWLHHMAEPELYGVKPPKFTEGETSMPENQLSPISQPVPDAPKIVETREEDIAPEISEEIEFKPTGDDRQLKELKKNLLSRIKTLHGIIDTLGIENLLDSKQIEKLRDALNAFQKEIDIIQTVAVLQDRLVRIAQVMQRLGFVEGHEELTKFGQAVPGQSLAEALRLIGDALNIVQRKEVFNTLSRAREIIDAQGLSTVEIDAATYSLLGAFRSAENNIRDAYEIVRRGGERRETPIAPILAPVVPAAPIPTVPVGLPAPAQPIPMPVAPVVGLATPALVPGV